MGAGKSELLRRLEKITSHHRGGSKMKYIESFLDHNSRFNPKIYNLIRKSLNLIYHSSDLKLKNQSFITLQRIVIEYSVNQIKDAINEGYTKIVLHNGYFTQTQVYAHASRFSALGLDSKTRSEYETILDKSEWLKYAETRIILCKCPIAMSYKRIVNRGQRAHQTKQSSLKFNAYCQLNRGFLTRCPKLPTFEIDTSIALHSDEYAKSVSDLSRDIIAL